MAESKPTKGRSEIILSVMSAMRWVNGKPLISDVMRDIRTRGSRSFLRMDLWNLGKQNDTALAADDSKSARSYLSSMAWVAFHHRSQHPYAS